MNRRAFKWQNIQTGLLAFVVVALTLFPFFWMAITSFKPQNELYSQNNPLIIKNPVLTHYFDLFQGTQFADWMVNSFTVALFATFISIIAATLAGYAWLA